MPSVRPELVPKKSGASACREVAGQAPHYVTWKIVLAKSLPNLRVVLRY